MRSPGRISPFAFPKTNDSGIQSVTILPSAQLSLENYHQRLKYGSPKTEKKQP